MSSLYVPHALIIDTTLQLMYIADTGNNRIRVINMNSYTINNLAGNSKGYANGLATAAMFSNPLAMAFDPIQRGIYVADTGNNRIRYIRIGPAPFTSVVSTYAGQINCM